jgi:hypothetical protein
VLRYGELDERMHLILLTSIMGWARNDSGMGMGTPSQKDAVPTGTTPLAQQGTLAMTTSSVVLTEDDYPNRQPAVRPLTSHRARGAAVPVLRPVFRRLAGRRPSFLRTP